MKPLINAKEAVQNIRAGASDEELMAKYGISARGLESLFTKLVCAGALDGIELDRRMLVSQKSHVVQLRGRPDPIGRAAVINPDEAVAAVRSGISDEGLMARYELSARGLDSLFTKLVEAAYVSEAELGGRRRSFDWAEVAFGRDLNSTEGNLRRTPVPDEPVTAQESPEPFRQIHKVWLAGIAGFLIGVVSISGLYLVTQRFDLRVVGSVSRPAHSAKDEGGSYDGKVEQIISILRAIEREARERGEFRAMDEAAEYRQCLESCGDISFDVDDEDRALLANCRNACITKYDRHMREIRKRFHGSPATR